MLPVRLETLTAPWALAWHREKGPHSSRDNGMAWFHGLVPRPQNQSPVRWAALGDEELVLRREGCANILPCLCHLAREAPHARSHWEPQLAAPGHRSPHTRAGLFFASQLSHHRHSTPPALGTSRRPWEVRSGQGAIGYLFLRVQGCGALGRLRPGTCNSGSMPS